MKDICFIIGHRSISRDRDKNLMAIIKYYKKYFPQAEYMLIEQDSSPKLQSQRIVPQGVNYLFVFNDRKYNRGWAFNIGAKRTDKKIIVGIDNDVVLKPEALLSSIEFIEKGEYDILTPYEEFLNVGVEQSHKFLRTLTIDWKDTELKNRYSANYYAKFGGVFVAKRETYLKLKGFNEKFCGWGGEDEEFIFRIRHFCKYTKLKGFNLYHLFHSRGIEATNKHSAWKNNLDLRNKIRYMNIEDLKKYMSTELKYFGDTNKYKWGN